MIWIYVIMKTSNHAYGFSFMVAIDPCSPWTTIYIYSQELCLNFVGISVLFNHYWKAADITWSLETFTLRLIDVWYWLPWYTRDTFTFSPHWISWYFLVYFLSYAENTVSKSCSYCFYSMLMYAVSMISFIVFFYFFIFWVLWLLVKKFTPKPNIV
jgi:hypothetical protein